MLNVRDSNSGICQGLLGWLLIVLCSDYLAAQMTAEQLSEYWAPVLVQDFDETLAARRDYLLAVDYDQDWRLDNNPTNTIAHELRSVAYAWWHQTENYVVLGYSVYRVEGANSAQNDIRSAVVLVERPSAAVPSGRFVGMAAQRGSEWGFAVEKDTVVQVGGQSAGGRGRGRGKGGGHQRNRPALDGQAFHAQVAVQSSAPTGVTDVDFARSSVGLHPVLYGTRLEHDLSTEVDTEGRPSLFEANDLTDWRGLRPMMEEEGRAHSTYASGKASDYMPLRFGLIYVPGFGESLLATPGRRARGKLSHHWEVFSYGLRPLDELWDRRTPRSPEEAKLPFFDDLGRLVGRGSRGPGTLPPWLQYSERELESGERVLAVIASPFFFDGTAAFVEVLGVATEEIVTSSLGSRADLSTAASEWGR